MGFGTTGCFLNRTEVIKATISPCHNMIGDETARCHDDVSSPGSQK